MNVIYKIIFILGVLFVCSCKQDGEQDISGDFTEAYIVLLNSYNRFKSLINGPKGFSNSFFDDIKRLFNAYVEEYAQNDFYASLGFDAVAIDNLKRIITTFNLNRYYYNTEVGNSFVHRLRQFSLKLIVPINNLLQKNDNIGVLKDSNNMEGLKELALMLDDVCVKWGMFVGQVKNAINEASNLTVKNAVINKLEILDNLEIENPNQQCVDVQGINNKLCDLKHELLQLFISIKDKVLELVKNVGKE
ncbi:hypothetical protein ACE4V3_05140 (plasmid) [Borrelia recurrentis]|uniref:Lipoprotein n=1 Tax=Borrelia recurrentis (strain A1) TaxID=412418 RepID=B5RRU5_BORRA|nr:hypothetical protein [Borrelia recurrentis]ACH95081.1 putative lipoprotein [Borrelia recurrentis A1]